MIHFVYILYLVEKKKIYYSMSSEWLLLNYNQRLINLEIPFLQSY